MTNDQLTDYDRVIAWAFSLGGRQAVREQSMPMQFIEMSGKTLERIVHERELPADRLRALGVTDESLVRINPQGDIELRRADRWDVIGGLLGDFAERVQRETGLDWA